MLLGKEGGATTTYGITHEETKTIKQPHKLMANFLISILKKTQLEGNERESYVHVKLKDTYQVRPMLLHSMLLNSTSPLPI